MIKILKFFNYDHCTIKHFVINSQKNRRNGADEQPCAELNMKPEGTLYPPVPACPIITVFLEYPEVQDVHSET